MRKFKTTAEIPVPEKLIDQVIGQEDAVALIKKAARQRRHVLMLGSPGTGKSMLAQAMAELMPAADLEDVLVYPNPNDENRPSVRVVRTNPSKEDIRRDPQLQLLYRTLETAQRMLPSAPQKPQKEEMGQGRRIIEQGKMRSQLQSRGISPTLIFLLLLMGAIVLIYSTNSLEGDNRWFVLAIIFGMAFFALMWRFTSQLGRRMGMMMGGDYSDPKLIVDNSGMRNAPFVDATGSKAGALLGDVKHDPLQCIPADAIVHLKNGKPSKIAELIDPLLETEGERELKPDETIELLGGHDERYCYTSTRALRVYKRKYTGELCEIETMRGYRFAVTPNHPLALLDGEGNVKYTEAGKLQENAFLISPYRLPINKKWDPSPDFLTFLAYFLADGYASQRTVGFKVKRQFKIDEIEKCLKANGFDYRKRIYRGATIFNINSAKLVRELGEMGARIGGKKSIPPLIYDLDAQGIRFFLSSYLSLDGYVNKQGQFELFSKELIGDFIPLLLKLGVRANVEERPDPGYGKGKLQIFLLFNNFEFAQEYAKRTINPYHQENVGVYLSMTTATHVTFADTVPVGFAFLEGMRQRTGLSQGRVHKAYYALKDGLKTSQTLTRQMLSSICTTMLSHTNCPDLYRLKNISDGTYSFDQIKRIGRKAYSGYVYNFTTESGNYLVNNVLTHNSGGLGTPAHLRVESGAIHRANKGVLFIDEMASLRPRAQQELLTAMQEKKYSITGQSEMSSGAIVKTAPVPCDFVLVASGNVVDIRGMHPALRSRIRGAGYEVFVQDSMPDTPQNEERLVQFVAQEVKKDAKIPHFTYDAVVEVIHEARRKAGRKKRLTLNLRELGGLVRAAGDIAIDEGAQLITEGHVGRARSVAASLEQQMSRRSIEYRKDYQMFLSEGYAVGKVNGLAVLGDGSSGLVLPIVAEVTPASSKSEGKLIATGKLGTIAKEAVENVSAIVKKHIGKDVSLYDIHVQFLQTYEGVEGDSASISIAIAVLSAMEGIGVDESYSITGSLSVRGEVLPVGGVTAKTEAAIDAGIKNIIVPKPNLEDIYLSEEMKRKIKILPVSNLIDVVDLVFKDSEKKQKILRKMRGMLNGKK